ncbi:MAG: hypothetical protein ACR2MX_06085 [Cyclobacteriaceae bacterium]
MNTYNEISSEVGHVGYRPYPSMTEATSLWRKLQSNPNVDDFKEALSLYRFVPEARTCEERNVIQIIDRALAEGKERLSLEPIKRNFWHALALFW